MSANNLPWVIRRGAVAAVAIVAAAALGPNHNSPRPKERLHSLTSRWSATGAPLRVETITRRSARDRNDRIGEFEVQRTGKRPRRGKKKKKKGETTNTASTNTNANTSVFTSVGFTVSRARPVGPGGGGGNTLSFTNNTNISCIIKTNTNTLANTSANTSTTTITPTNAINTNTTA